MTHSPNSAPEIAIAHDGVQFSAATEASDVDATADYSSDIASVRALINAERPVPKIGLIDAAVIGVASITSLLHTMRVLNNSKIEAKADTNGDWDGWQ